MGQKQNYASEGNHYAGSSRHLQSDSDSEWASLQSHRNSQPEIVHYCIIREINVVVCQGIWQVLV